MITAILTETDWITVPCYEKNSHLILCQNKLNKSSKGCGMMHTNLKTLWCEEGQFFVGTKCYQFVHYTRHTNISIIYLQIKDEKELTNIDIHENISIGFTELFSLIQHYSIQPLQFTVLITLNGSFINYLGVQMSVYKTLYWLNKTGNKIISQHDGYLLFPVSVRQYELLTALFHCADDSYIDETLVCNGINDCSQGTDEVNCTCNNYLQMPSLVCKYICYDNYKKCTCSNLFYQCSSLPICIPYKFVCDGQKDCPQGEDEFCSRNISNTKHRSQNVTPVSFTDDFPTSADEEEYSLTFSNSSNIICSNNELLCVPAHDYCFPLSKLCIYDFQHNSLQLKYCLNGAHLQNCTYFQCLGYFKCPLSYCINYDHVCNGKWDCPDGHDEHNCLSYSCPHLFRCKNQNKYLHFSKVCDKGIDCIFGDDESLCVPGYSLSCPLHCICFAQSVICEHLSHITPQEIWHFIKYFKCNSCTLKYSDTHLFSLSNITFLDIKYHFYEYICISKDMNNPIFSSLRKLDISFNKITTIKCSCFESLESLKFLNLQVNRISNVDNKAFASLRNLKILDLSYNRITKLTKGTFIGLLNIAVINITLNIIKSINIDTFSSIYHSTVHSLNRKVCCMAGVWLKCKVNDYEFSNCNDLLSNKGLTQMCWFIGTFTVLINSISIGIHIKLFSQLQKNKYFTLSLSVVDHLYGMHLLIICSADLYYRGYYAGAEYTWKQSFLCKASSLITLISFMVSPIILFIMVLARFCIIQWPMTSKFKNDLFTKMVTLAIVICIVTFCFIVSFIYELSNHVPSEICVLLTTSEQKSYFILFTTLLVICVQMFGIISNFALSILTILKIIKIKKDNTSHSLTKEQIKNIIIHFLFVMLKNNCAWIPSTISFFLPLTGYKVSSNLFSWVIITVVPVNAVVNPILLSIVTPSIKRWFFGQLSTFYQILIKRN